MCEFVWFLLWGGATNHFLFFSRSCLGLTTQVATIPFAVSSLPELRRTLFFSGLDHFSELHKRFRLFLLAIQIPKEETEELCGALRFGRSWTN